MNRDFTEQPDQWTRQMEWPTSALHRRALVYAELPIAEKFPRYRRHSHKAWQAMLRRQAQWRSQQPLFG